LSLVQDTNPTTPVFRPQAGIARVCAPPRASLQLRARHCGFCLKMVDLLVFGENPDGLLLRWLGGEVAARTLAKFTSDLVDLIVMKVAHSNRNAQWSSTESRGGCCGQTLVLEAIYEFLFTRAPMHTGSVG
jgi:hypothetical protein